MKTSHRQSKRVQRSLQTGEAGAAHRDRGLVPGNPAHHPHHLLGSPQRLTSSFLAFSMMPAKLVSSFWATFMHRLHQDLWEK